MRNQLVSLKRSSYGLSLLLALTLSFVSCTRPKEELKNSSIVSFSFSQTLDQQGLGSKFTAQTAANAQLVHVSISVSGPGIPNAVLLTWDSCRNCIGLSTSPSSFELTVPSGENRLIQVMTVYQDPSSNQMEFNYGDTTTTVSGAAMSVPVSMALLNTTTVVEGQVSGRYLTGADSGPTGIVDVKYRPAGKPAMTIMQEDIIAGWFSFFMLSGIQFEYVIRNTGEIMWGRGVSLDDSLMAYGPSDRQLVMFTPDHVFQRYENSVYVDKIDSANIRIWGYWGSGTAGVTSAASKRVCHDMYSFPTPSSKYESYRTSPIGPDPGNYNGTKLNYDTHGSQVALTSLLKNGASAPSLGKIVISGGAYASSYCGPATADYSSSDTTKQFLNFMVISMSYVMEGESKDNRVGYRGTIVRDTYGAYLNIGDYGSIKRLSGRLLPGTHAEIDGYKLYKAYGFAQNQYIDRPSCPEIASGSTSFVSASNFVPISSGDLLLDSDIPLTRTTGVVTVLCPFKDGKALPVGGQFSGTYQYGESMASSIEIYDLATGNILSSNADFASDACTPYQIRGISDDPSIEGKLPYSGINLNRSGTYMGLSIDNDCSTISSTLNVSAGYSSRATFYARSSSFGQTETISFSSPSIASTLVRNFTSHNVAYDGVTQLSFWSKSQGRVGQCQEVQISVKNAAGFIAPLATTVIVNLTSTAGVSFYNNQMDCDYATSPIVNKTLIGSAPLSTKSSSAVFYFKSSVPGPVTITATSSAPSLTADKTINFVVQ